MLESNPMTSARLSNIYLSSWNFLTESKLQAPAIFYTTLAYYVNESYRDIFDDNDEYNLDNAYLLYFDFFNQLTSNKSLIFKKTDGTIDETKVKNFDTAFLNSMKFLNRNLGPLMENWTWSSLTDFDYKINRKHKRKVNIYRKLFVNEKKTQIEGGPDSVENIQLNAKFDVISISSFQSIMTDDTLWFKMKSGYSTSIFSDFYFRSNTIDKFENINSPKQAYKTVIMPE
jgi:hypothetical protein